MIVEALLVGVSIFLLAGVIHSVNEKWGTRYIIAVALTVAVTITVLIKLVTLLTSILTQLLTLLHTIVRKLIKAVFYILVGIIAFPIILFSYPAPRIGKGAELLNRSINRNNIFSGLVSEAQYARSLMVDIVAEIDDQELKFNNESEYRYELRRVKELGKRRLSIGESILSLLIGGLLLVSQIYGLDIFQIEIEGLTISTGIQIGLFVIALSIAYRVTILEFLSYEEDAEFSSLNEMDVALSYQRSIALVGFVQYLMFMFVFAMYLANADRKTIKDTIKYCYQNSYFESMRYAWERINEDE